MRKRALTIGCVSLGIAMGLLGSPVALADDAEFVREAKGMGFLQEDNNLISQAQSACYFFVRNRGADEIEARIVRYTRIDPPSKAHPFLVLAVNTYCPQFADRVGA